MSSINSLGIKLGNTKCRLACAFITEWSSLEVKCLNGIGEQFATKTEFTVNANAEYSGGFEQYFANANDHPSNIIFDALNFINSKSICYMDEDFGDIFAKKQENGKYKLQFYDENYQPQKIIEYKDIEVTAGILAKLLETAKEQLPENGAELQQIVITIPSLAEYEYRKKLLEAVKILSLPSNIDVQFMAQITAAAIAYRHKEGDVAQGKVMFFYMGARNTEFAIYKFLESQTPELLFADGSVEFGGENFTVQLVQKQMTELKRENQEKWQKMCYEEKRIVYRNVRIAMEKIKANLGFKESATIKIDLGPTLQDGKFTITREQFEEICKDECQQLRSFLISKINKFNEGVNGIVLVGESSKLYLVQNLFRTYCNKEKILKMNALAPELASVQGAAIKAAYEVFEKSGNAMPKCLTKPILPNYSFHAIYGIMNNYHSSNLPCYLVQSGQQIPTKPIPVKSIVDIEWHEQDAYGKNCKEIMKMRMRYNDEYFVKIDKNGLLQFEINDGQIWCPKNAELEECIEKFKQYEADVIRMKKEQLEYEEKRKEERRSKAKLKQEKLTSEQKVVQENEKKMNLKRKKNHYEKTGNTQIAETKVNMITEGNEQKKSTNLEGDNDNEYVVGDSFEIIPSVDLNDDFDDGQKKKSKDYINVFIEIPNSHESTQVHIKGSWDNWTGMIPMKYSKFTNSFLTILSLPFSKNEFEFNFIKENQYLQKIWFDTKHSIRFPKTFINEDEENRYVNYLKLNSNTQIDNNPNSFSAKYLLEKILTADNSMKQLVNEMNTTRIVNFDEQYVKQISQKYLKIRNALSMQINAHEVDALIDEADRFQTYLEIIFSIFGWKKLMEENFVLKENDNAESIFNYFKDKLEKFMMSKEEVIYEFKSIFCKRMLEECKRIGLEGKSKEIQQLNAFMDKAF